MVPILNGDWEKGFYVRSDLCYLICWRHLIRSKIVTIRICSPKRHFFPSRETSDISTMFNLDLMTKECFGLIPDLPPVLLRQDRVPNIRRRPRHVRCPAFRSDHRRWPPPRLCLLWGSMSEWRNCWSQRHRRGSTFRPVVLVPRAPYLPATRRDRPTDVVEPTSSWPPGTTPTQLC